VSGTRSEIRAAEERRGFGCAGCAWSTWFDEMVDFGWWCDERNHYMGEAIMCDKFVRVARGTSSEPREWCWLCAGCETYNLPTTPECRKCGESRTDDRG